jgi:hypothetical protein
MLYNLVILLIIIIDYVFYYVLIQTNTFSEMNL